MNLGTFAAEAKSPLPPPHYVHPFGAELWREEQVREFAAAEAAKARREAMQQCAAMLDAEHERSKHMHNYAACYARAIRERMEKP